MIFNLSGGGAGDSEAKIIVPIPTVSVGTYTYNGTAQGPTVGEYDSSKIIVRNATATDAGTYTLTLSLRNTNKMVWTDLTTADKTYSYTIGKMSLSVPTVTGSFTYDTTQKSATIGQYDSTYITQGGTASATNAGTYTVTFDLNDTTNTEWSGGGTVQKSGTWTIAQATGALSLSKSTVTLNTSTLSDTITVTVTGDGTVTAVSSDTSVATVTKSGNVFTIAGVNNTSGSATITFTLSATTNYTGATATASVTATYGPTVVTFSGGTDAQISDMIDYAHANSGYKLSDYWAVGDTRTISISAFTGGGSVSHAAQDIDIVITSFEDYEGCGAVMQFDFKDELASANRMNSSNTNSGGYDSSEMYTTTLPALVNALPAWLKNRLRTFNVKAGTGGGSTSVETCTGNKLALRSEWEMFGEKTYAAAGANGAEASGAKQIAYYATSSNRIKKRGHTGSTGTWWLRSPYSSNGFCFVHNSGNASSYGASDTRGVAPFGCL